MKENMTNNVQNEGTVLIPEIMPKNTNYASINTKLHLEDSSTAVAVALDIKTAVTCHNIEDIEANINSLIGMNNRIRFVLGIYLFNAKELFKKAYRDSHPDEELTDNQLNKKISIDFKTWCESKFGFKSTSVNDFINMSSKMLGFEEYLEKTSFGNLRKLKFVGEDVKKFVEGELTLEDTKSTPKKSSDKIELSDIAKKLRDIKSKVIDGKVNNLMTAEAQNKMVDSIEVELKALMNEVAKLRK